nr:DUF4229 domain-containing protein [Psychromicrobium silvestre]
MKYFLIRVGILIPLFVIFMLLGLGAVFSVIAATLIAFCVAYLFFRPQRNAAAESIRTAVSPEARKDRAKKRVTDGDIEDSLIEANPEVGIDNDQKPSARKLPPAEQLGSVDETSRVPKDFTV